MLQLTDSAKVDLYYFAPGKPTQRTFIESFNR
jgi:hypothetical protein